MSKTICLYSSSSDAIAPAFFAATPTEAVTQIVAYQAPALATKWFHQQG